MIKDSGDRTEFETGAKRDMHAGKGRMDLLPWYGIMEVSKHCEEGALKYGEHNVDKGIPLHSLLDSASRHLAKYMVGMDDEDHLRAACWNLLWALNQRETHPELDDRFVAKVGEVKKKNYQVLCPNCEATIIKENGQICDGVAWRVGVPNEKVELKCNYCNHSVIVSIKDILDDRFVSKMKSSNDEQLITVVCSSCGSHFEAPTEWWARKRSQYTNIPDGVMTTCPHCGNVTIVREVKPDE
jgi:DNA-directed RNA polymerase subunit RPC12/RpoP